MSLGDAHAHFFENGYLCRCGTMFPSGGELNLYDRLRRVHDVAQVLAVGYEGKPRYRGNNRYLKKLASDRRWIYPLAFCPVDMPPTVRQTHAWRNDRFEGISLYVTNRTAARRLREWPPPVIAALNRQRSIISINTPMMALTDLFPFLRQIDQCRILIAHLGLPGIVKTNSSLREARQLIERIRPLAILPNVGIKASAFYATGLQPSEFPHSGSHAIFSELYKLFGQSRLYWGSDFSPALEYVSFPQTITVLDHLGLSDRDKALILGGNLRVLLSQTDPTIFHG